MIGIPFWKLLKEQLKGGKTRLYTKTATIVVRESEVIKTRPLNTIRVEYLQHFIFVEIRFLTHGSFVDIRCSFLLGSLQPVYLRPVNPEIHNHVIRLVRVAITID